MEVVRMLWAGVVHADLSSSTSCWGERPRHHRSAAGVDAAGNNHACRMLLRDVANLRSSSAASRRSCFTPTLAGDLDLYHRGALHPEVVLTGRFERKLQAVDLGGVMREIDDARLERRRAFCACSWSVRDRPLRPAQRLLDHLAPSRFDRGAPCLVIQTLATEPLVGLVGRRLVAARDAGNQFMQPPQRFRAIFLEAAELLRLDDHHSVLADALSPSFISRSRIASAATRRRCRIADEPRWRPC